MGVDFLVKYLEISGQKIRLNIWDTAGKERFKSVNKSYYWGSDFFFLTFDLPSKISFDNLNECYYEFCENSEKNAKIILLFWEIKLI